LLILLSFQHQKAHQQQNKGESLLFILPAPFSGITCTVQKETEIKVKKKKKITCTYIVFL